MELWLALMLGLTGQHPSSCGLLDASRPPEFIVFERLGDGDAPAGESRHRVWLRLRNNSSCELRLPRGMGRACDGSVATALTDGACVRLDYDLFDGMSPSPRRREVRDPQWQAEGAPSNAVIASGRSILFTVPQSHFIDDRILGVPVSDLREEADALVGTQRYALFGRADVPIELRPQLRRD